MEHPALADLNVQHREANLNGLRYHYLLSEPEGGQKGTVFLIHGWPDISVGWAKQIPALTKMGLRTVVPDLPGFGRTETPEILERYGLKQVADDLKELARQLGVSKIILGGHDWGGMVVYRVCLYHPDLVSNLFSVCTPYMPPNKSDFVSLEDFVGRYPNFQYMLQLASGEVEKRVNTPELMRGMLNSAYGGRGPNGEPGFVTTKGVIFENLLKIGQSPLMSAQEMDFYVNEYMGTTMHYPLNWYRTRKINHEAERSLYKSQIDIPVLFIAASKDAALPPAMSTGMEEHIPNLTRFEVPTSHWALIEAPGLVNMHITTFLQKEYFGQLGKTNL